ncbi:hypothetical protein [Inhella proteolytica]|uniref:Uncharacterized protein n=1 Tax=Inhella proteolytica TaxID=2795029 RepID=A0A931J3T9_9BURK|nr:hypothetical protein [Inhella proteolytica]MBH9577243.1 hypothetical protein [Inhella proteolytica]
MARATPPMQETLRIHSETQRLFGITDDMRAFPWSAALREAERQGFNCTATGAPVQNLALEGRQLLLIDFGRCGPEPLSLLQAYGSPGAPIPAQWISGRLWFPKGRKLCGNPYANEIWEWHVQLEVQQGRVESMRTVDMRRSPLIPHGRKADRSWCLRPPPPPALPPVAIEVITRKPRADSR